MGGGFLLDTSVIIDLFGGDLRVARSIAEAERVFVPAIAVGELVYGAHRSTRREARLQQVRSFVVNITVLSCDLETAEVYGPIKDRLRAKGRPLPENDVWIAAVARQHGLVLAARDAHFHEIDDLPVVAWTS